MSTAVDSIDKRHKELLNKFNSLSSFHDEDDHSPAQPQLLLMPFCEATPLF